MTKKLSDDIYVYLCFNEDEENLGLKTANSLEEFQKAMEDGHVLSWANIIGRDMEITEFHEENELVLLPTEWEKDDEDSN